jgi:fatty-acyl-CoA synthase
MNDPTPIEAVKSIVGEKKMELTLAGILLQAMRRNHALTALRVGERTTSYHELDEESARVAANLSRLGVAKGDRVALYLRNSAEYVIADLAILKLGAVKVPLNEYQSLSDVVHILNETSAQAVIAHQSLLVALGEGLQDQCEISLMVTVPDATETEPAGDFHRWQELSTNGPDFTPAVVKADDIAMIAYTGGTTGAPKGVVHTQQGLAINLFAHIIAGEISANDTMLLLTPLPHSAGYHMQACMLQGGQVVLSEKFDPAVFYAYVAQHKVTWTFLVPTMIYRLLDHPEKNDHSTLRTIVYGAAPMSTARLEHAIEQFGHAFIQLYGQTECPNFITALTKNDHRTTSLHGACGQAVPFVEVATRGENGTGLGEVMVRSPYLLKEYYLNPEATAAALQDGWLQTGDIGYLDENGYLFLMDRAKDMIISGGMNVYSTEVEQVLKRHPSVADAAIVGLPHADWGELVHAVIISSEPVAAEELLELCREELSRYKIPKSFEFRESLPLTAYGKVDKKALRKESTPTQHEIR